VDADPGIHNVSSPGDTVSPGDTISPDSYSLTVMNDTVSVGQPVEVLIIVNELTPTDDIIAYQFDLGFDNSVMEYAGCDITGTISEGGELAVNPNIAGQLSISYMNLTPLDGSGALIKIQFSSLAVDTSIITIYNAYLNNSPVQELIDGIMIIKKIIPPTAAITYSDTINRFADTLVITATFSETMHEANTVQLSLSGASILTDAVMTRQSETVYLYNYQIPNADGEVTVRLSNGTDLWGNEIDSVLTGGDTFHIVKFSPGDVDDDGVILAYDAAITLQYSVGLDPLATIDPLPWENWRDSTANVDGIDGISAYDAGLILQYSAGIITSFSGETNKSLFNSDVSLEIVGNEIIFYSHGELLGINLSSTNENGILGIPEVLNENFMSAFNIREATYKIGLCTAVSPENGTAFMKIPFKNSGSVTFNMLVNTMEKIETINLTTEIVELQDEDILVYPNPARDKLFIKVGEYGILEGYQVRIVNQLGGTVFEDRINESQYAIDLMNGSNHGLFYLIVSNNMGITVLTRKILLQ